MNTKIIAFFITIVSMSAASSSYAQTGGMQIGMLDGSVKNLLQIETEFPLATDPGNVRVRIAKLPAATLEACMASTDFSAAVPMSTRDYVAVYDQATAVERFGFGVEREMKEGPNLTDSNCHVVRFAGDGDSDGRDFLIWQRSVRRSAALIDPGSENGATAAALADGSVRHIQYRTSSGF
jgi:hypothetical protein